MSEETSQRDSELQERLVAAHEGDDLAPLISLYREAADLAELDGDRDRAAFFMTHAWIFALEVGSADAVLCADQLREWGRL